MYFDVLHNRLLETLKYRIRNGEFTERRLAFLAGISQPHVHNVLKGARALSPEMADRILKTLKLSVLDLLEPHELGARGQAGGRALAPTAAADLLELARALRHDSGTLLAEAESVRSLNRSLAGAARAGFEPAGPAPPPLTPPSVAAGASARAPRTRPAPTGRPQRRRPLATSS